MRKFIILAVLALRHEAAHGLNSPRRFGERFPCMMSKLGQDCLDDRARRAGGEGPLLRGTAGADEPTVELQFGIGETGLAQR